MATHCFPANSIFGSSNPSFIPKPSYGTFRSNAATNFSHSLNQECKICLNRSPILPRRGRIVHGVMAYQCKFDIFGDTIGEYNKGCGIYSLSMPGFANPPFSSSRSSIRLLSKGFGPFYDAFAKRVFSAKIMPKSNLTSARTSTVFAEDQKGSKSDSLYFDKHRKRVKAFASQGSIEGKPYTTFSGRVGNRVGPGSQLSAHKIVNIVNCSDVMAREGQKEGMSTESLPSSSTVDNKQESKTEIKKKQRPRNRKKTEETSDSQSSSKNIVTKSSPKVKKPDRLPPQASEKSSTENITKEEAGLSHSPATTPQKKATRSRKKEKSLKEDGVEVKVYNDLPKPKPKPKSKPKPKPKPKEDVKQASSVKNISQQAKPPTVNGVEAKIYNDLPKPKPKTKPKPEDDDKQALSVKKISQQPKPPIVNGVEVKIYNDLAKPKPKTKPKPKPEEDVKQAPSVKNISKQPKPPTVNGIKSITLNPLYPPVGKSVVVVESLTKAKVIQRYLGDMYEVIPSYGHVRDLAARSGSVRPDDDFSMVWEVPSAAWAHLKSMKVAVSGADNLILASDPDREGEAIAWHIIEMLQQQHALHQDITVARVTFQEITEAAIKNALQTPRDIDVNLVHAYLARRALDYLIGFNISPLLWRKLPGCQSAGRVQSAALALISDREMEIEEFKPQEYWSIGATFTSKEALLSSNCLVRSYLTRFGSAKLTQFSIGSESEAKNVEQSVNASNFNVTGVKRSKLNKNPPTPYITSTLQQDAANKLNFTAAYTMKLAQKLYEGIELSDGKAAGLITYMRTDGLHISDEAAKGICSLITERYGLDYSASTPRKFFKKVKNAQEAHEAIRPTDIRRLPSMLVGALEEDSLKLYTLIWARTIACQMEAAKIDQIQLDIGCDDGSISFRAACSTVSFPGFRSVYEDAETKAIRDTEIEPSGRDEIYKTLGNLKQGDPLSLGNIELKQHHTQPPPRYSEASLVKKLEELGIGRPSTYASTIKVLQDRKYVTAKSRVLSPEFRGRMVSAFLSHYFSEVTDYSFTADMETELDNVSGGLTEWKGLLKDYWSRFSTYCDRAGKVNIHQVEKMLERTFGNFLFSSLPDEARTCPSCLEGTLIFKVSRFGAGYFIGCDQHPKCKFIAKTLYGEEEDDEAPQNNNSIEEPKLLGIHPTSGEKVLLKAGPYGTYVQLGEDRKGYSPKRASVSQIKDVNSITLEDALDLLRYPVSLGNHPVDGQPVVIKISKTGFTIRHRHNIAPVPKGFPGNDITMEKAIELLSSPDVRRWGRRKGKLSSKEHDVDD